jgi:hypothetical protein
VEKPSLSPEICISQEIQVSHSFDSIAEVPSSPIISFNQLTIVEKVSGWGRFVDSFGATRKEFSELSSADDDKYVHVYDDAYNFLKACNDSIHDLNYFLRQELIRTSEHEPVQNRGFQPLRTINSVKNYAKTLAQLILFLKRTGFRPDIFEVYLEAIDDNGENRIESFLLVVLSGLAMEMNIFAFRTEFPAIKFVISWSITSSGSFIEPGVITKCIAHLKFALRCIVLTNLVKNQDPTMLRYVRCDGNTLMAGFQSYMALFSTISEPASNPRVEFAYKSGSLDYSILKVNNLELPLSRIATGYTQLLSQTNSMIFELIDKYSRIKLLELEIHDDCTNKAPFYAFFNDARNKELKSIIQSFKQFSKKYLTAKFGFKDLISKIGRVTENLIALIHLDSGLPARSTEIGTWKICNDSFGNPRNVYWYFNTICIFAIYNKSESLSMREKRIPRFLSQELSVSTIQFLIFLRPLQM